VKLIVAKFPTEFAVSVCESQSAFSHPKVAYSNAYTRNNFSWLPESIKRLKSQRLLMKIASNKLSVVKGEAGENVSTKLQAMLKRNPGFSAFTSVCQVLNGDAVDSPEDITPEKIHLLNYAPVTSCDVEKSFPAYKQILSDEKKSMTPENMEKILIVYCA
jgi:hypothetical protein